MQRGESRAGTQGRCGTCWMAGGEIGWKLLVSVFVVPSLQDPPPRECTAGQPRPLCCFVLLLSTQVNVTSCGNLGSVPVNGDCGKARVEGKKRLLAA